MALTNLKQQILDCFTSDSKVNTLNTLLNNCHCSEVTLRRKIKQTGLLVSYNHNSKFYTLPSLASFNAHGVWDCKGVYFSTHGNLVNTVKKLVYQSKAGYTPIELKTILFVKINDLLRIQTDKQIFKREKTGRSYVYYSNDTSVYATQHRERQLLIAGSSQKNIKDKDIVIAILVEIIHSGNTCEQAINRQLKSKSKDIDIQKIQGVISHYGIKKTMHKS